MNRIDNNLRLAIEDGQIVPDIVDTIPLHKVQIRYPSGVDVDLGNELKPFSVKDQPWVEWPTEVRQYYTLIMTDPDAPSRQKPSKREIIHWLVINIPGINLNKGQTLANYRGPTPLNGTGLHRNVILVYKQLGIIPEITLNGTSHQMRINFNTRVFAKTYRLGEPIAVNFYVSQFDEYVALLRSQIQTKINDKPKNELKVSSKRAKLLDWAPRKPKTPKFPQMVCINYMRYQEIQNLLKTYEINKFN